VALRHQFWQGCSLRWSKCVGVLKTIKQMHDAHRAVWIDDEETGSNMKCVTAYEQQKLVIVNLLRKYYLGLQAS